PKSNRNAGSELEPMGSGKVASQPAVVQPLEDSGKIFELRFSGADGRASVSGRKRQHVNPPVVTVNLREQSTTIYPPHQLPSRHHLDSPSAGLVRSFLKRPVWPSGRSS